jgi:putative transposase
MIEINENEEDIGDDKKLLSFSICENNQKFIKLGKKAILDHKHLENMINMLLIEQYDKHKNSENYDDNKEEKWKIFNLLRNSVIMKPVLTSNTGGAATGGEVTIVNDYFKNHKIMKELKKLGQLLNDKNMACIIKRLSKDWKVFFKNKKTWYKKGKASNLTGLPSHPKPKSLKFVNQYSIPMDNEKFSLKQRNLLGLNYYRKMKYTSLMDNEYISNKKINNVVVCYKNGCISYRFCYVYEEDKYIEINPRKNRKSKLAGGDVGVYNLMSIFVHDKTTESLLIDNGIHLAKNRYYNKIMDDLKREISYQIKSTKIVIDKNGEECEVPNEYTNQGKKLKKTLGFIIEDRNRYFDDQYNKLSKKILQYLAKNKVTELVLSKNLNHVKSTGEIKQASSFSQKFYQIPFGKLVNLLGKKSSKYAINVIYENEAYTSQSSCINDNVKEIQELRKERKITPNDLSGSRGAKGKKLTRGMYKDKKLNIVFNSDINGAANHIKVAYKDINYSYLKNYLWKLCNPIKIKSAAEFDCLLKA